MAETCEIDELEFVQHELERLVQLRFSNNWCGADEHEYLRLSERELALLTVPRQLPLFEDEA